MATPLRLNELACPRCGRASWVLDSNYWGMDGEWVPYERRSYECRVCGIEGRGWTLLQQSPPAFLHQPSLLYPMTQAEFDYWVGILRANFPDHRRLADPGFVPCTPEEARAHEEAFERLHPVFEMRDQDGARRCVPRLDEVLDWADMMEPRDVLSLFRRDGASLRLTATEGKRWSVTCVGADGRVIAEAPALELDRIRASVRRYLDGDAEPFNA